MSRDYISATRKLFQDIDQRGRPVDKPTYGLLVADDFTQGYIDIYASAEELEKAIAECGMIALVSEQGIDFDVDEDDPIWKGPNYAGAKPRRKRNKKRRD